MAFEPRVTTGSSWEITNGWSFTSHDRFVVHNLSNINVKLTYGREFKKVVCPRGPSAPKGRKNQRRDHGLRETRNCFLLETKLLPPVRPSVPGMYSGAFRNWSSVVT